MVNKALKMRQTIKDLQAYRCQYSVQLLCLVRNNRGDPGSIPGQSMWNLWLKKWHSHSDIFSPSISVYFCRCHSTHAILSSIHLLLLQYIPSKWQCH